MDLHFALVNFSWGALQNNLLNASFWRDEAFTGLLIRHNPWQIITLLYHDSTPPLYYLLLYVWQHLWGDSEIALRSLSVVFFLAGTITIWQIGRYLKYPNAWVLILLSLTQPLVFRLAFEARAYALLYFLSALIIYFFLKKKYLPLVLTGIALLYTHILGICILAILLVWAFVKKYQWRWLLIPFILFIPWIPSIQTFNANGGALPYQINWVWIGQMLLLTGAPVIILIPYLRSLLKSENFQLFALLYIVPFIGLALYSKLKTFLFLDRYFIELIPAVLLMAGAGFGKKFYYYLVTGVILIQAFISYNLFVSPEQLTKPPYRQMVSYINSHQKSGDLIINDTPLTYLEAHYYNLNSLVYNPYHHNVPTYLGKALIPDSDIIDSLPKANRYWVISVNEGGGTSSDPFPARVISKQTFGQLNLTLYEAT